MQINRIGSWVGIGIFIALAASAAESEDFLTKTHDLITGLSDTGPCKIQSVPKSEKVRFTKESEVRSLEVTVNCPEGDIMGVFFQPTFTARFQVSNASSLRERVAISQGSNVQNLSYNDTEMLHLDILHDGKGKLLEIDFRLLSLGKYRQMVPVINPYSVVKRAYWKAD